MSDQNIERPLLLNDSLKDSLQKSIAQNQSLKQSIEPPASHHIAPEVGHIAIPIREELVQQPQLQPQQFRHKSEYGEDMSAQGRVPQQIKTSVIIEEPRHKIEQALGSIISEPQTLRIKGSRRYRVMQTCGIACLLIGIIFILGLPPFIGHVIVSQAIEQVVMTQKNQGLWAHFPGDTQTIITRNFTFFRLMNEDDFLLRHQKPQFQEVSGFIIQELEDFLDINYLEEGNKVEVRDWLRFKEWSQSRNIDTKVNVLNMGNLGYWSTLKAARPTLLLQQGMATLFTSMEQSILPTLLGTGINTQFLPNKTTTVNSLLLPAGIEQQNHEFLWSDPSFGLQSPSNLGQWVIAAIDSFDNSDKSYRYSNQANSLKNYFVLSDDQIQGMLKKIYSYVVNLRSLLIQNHYCVNMAMSECTGRYLAMAQMTEGWVSAKPPPVSTTIPNDTICENNNTCIHYYPQIYAYEKNIYWGARQPNSTITFTRQQVQGWFNYNKSVTPGVEFNTAENCLLHIGNLDKLWEWGTNYDDDLDQFGLDKIQKRMKLDNITQAKVAWEWLKYMTKQFTLQKQSNDRLGISNLFAQGLYQQFALLQDTLQPFLLQKMVREQIVECHLFFQNTLQEPEHSQLVDSLCKQYDDVHAQEFIKFIIGTCEKKYGPTWQELRSKGVSLLAMEYHCQVNGGSNLGSILHRVKIQLDSKYNCSTTPKSYCSNFQLAAKQWSSSQVTSNPPQSLLSELPPSSTFYTWNSKVKAFEYGYFLSKFNDEERKELPTFETEQIFSLFTFEEWFSAPVIMKYITGNKLKDRFIDYIRWFGISVTLNGLTTNRTAREILFGYEDQYLAQVKNSYPPFGGDPSAPSVIALNDLNLTEAQSNQKFIFKTGKEDFRDVYQNYQINGYRYFVNNYTWFTGNETVWGWKSPWAQEDYFYGTTAKIFAPNQFEADNLSLLIPQVQRYGSNFFHNMSYPMQRFGIDLYISYLSNQIGQVAPHNDKYYQTLPNVFNVSSIYGLPLFATKNHFLNCSEWLERVDIYNEDYSIKYEQVSHWDDTFILVEPYTGVSFQSNIYLQNNYYHQPDQLYPYPINTMMPIFSIARGGNLTENKFHELYDPLLLGLTFKSVVVYLGIAIVLVSIAMLVIGTYCLRKIGKSQTNERYHSQLGISLQEVRQEDQSKEKMTLEAHD